MFKLAGGEKLLVGMDISDGYTQISYCTLENSDEVETLSLTAGTEKFNIPTLLCRKPKTNQWFIGREARKVSEEENGILIKNLVSLAMDAEPVCVEGTDLDPVYLLSVYLKRCFSLLSKLKTADKIDAVMFTGNNTEGRFREVFLKAMEDMRIKREKIFFQSHSESFYYYILSQPENLWENTTALMEYEKGSIKFQFLECNRNNAPAVVFIEEERHPFTAYGVADMGGNLSSGLEQMDRNFLNLCRECFENRNVSSIYLIGEEFSMEWMKESLKYLCEGRRVFQGNNLYGKGACYGLLEQLETKEGDYVFMGGDKLKANIGMKLLRQGNDVYLPIFEAGMGWQDADNGFEFYIQEGNQIDIMITSLVGKGNKLAQIILEGLPEGISRMRAHFMLKDVEHLVVEIEDLGLGSMRPASHNIWKEEIEI